MACGQCQQRKRRCDGAQPCEECQSHRRWLRRRGLGTETFPECQYPPPVNKKSPWKVTTANNYTTQREVQSRRGPATQGASLQISGISQDVSSAGAHPTDQSASDGNYETYGLHAPPDAWSLVAATDLMNVAGMTSVPAGAYDSTIQTLGNCHNAAQQGSYGAFQNIPLRVIQWTQLIWHTSA
jgi:hypothetical protein